MSANPPPIPAALGPSGGGAIPEGNAVPAVTTTFATQSSVPIRLTVTQLVSGETIVTAQRADGSDCSTCLTSRDVAPIPGDPQGTVEKLEKAISEGEGSGAAASRNLAVLAQAHAALTTAQAQLDQLGQAGGSAERGEESGESGPDRDDLASLANTGAHIPQGVSSGSLSLVV